MQLPSPMPEVEEGVWFLMQQEEAGQMKSACEYGIRGGEWTFSPNLYSS